MLKSMSWIKIITINIALILALLSLLYIAPPIVFIGYKTATAKTDLRTGLPNYEKVGPEYI